MPLYNYECPACKAKVRHILDRAKAKDPQTCKCGTFLVRIHSAPTTQVVETLDNGLMTRRLERPAEAERLYRERSEKDPLKDD